MREIIKLIVKNQFTIVFVLLEVLAFLLVIGQNNYQKNIFAGECASLSGVLSDKISSVNEYLSLKHENDALIAENVLLRNKLELFGDTASSVVQTHGSTLSGYIFHSAKTINISINKSRNSITLNKGLSDGIRPDMSVCSPDGVVGIVTKCSEHFCKVMPVINTDLKLSARLKNSDYYGPLQWDGGSVDYSYLNDIPRHVVVHKGDTIVTSGLSPIFPKDIMVGVVDEIDRNTANFVVIKVKLSVDFRKVINVMIVENTNKFEIEQLEN